MILVIPVTNYCLYFTPRKCTVLNISMFRSSIVHKCSCSSFVQWKIWIEQQKVLIIVNELEGNFTIEQKKERKRLMSSTSYIIMVLLDFNCMKNDLFSFISYIYIFDV